MNVLASAALPSTYLPTQTSDSAKNRTETDANKAQSAPDKKPADSEKSFEKRIVDKFAKAIGREDDKIEKFRQEDIARDKAAKDLAALRNAVERYQPGSQTVDTSKINVVLPEGSPLEKEGTWSDKDQAYSIPLEKMVAYYQTNHPELYLPSSPKTLDQLDSYKHELQEVVKIASMPLPEWKMMELEKAQTMQKTLMNLLNVFINAYMDSMDKILSR
jgi:hypothetical protein